MSVTPKALDFSAKIDISNAATEQLVPTTTSSSTNNSTHRVKVHCLSRELSNIMSTSDLDDTAKVSAIANAVEGLNLTNKLKEKLQISLSKRKRCCRKLLSLSTRQSLGILAFILLYLCHHR